MNLCCPYLIVGLSETLRGFLKPRKLEIVPEAVGVTSNFGHSG